ncbi:hypothetical protein HY967_02750 [Candidatus Jorgensenbacteria bacterium]|nr:hypothetical protein [Candidatus Jorgensenbacteria bacterium]
MSTNQKGFANIILIVVGIILMGTIAYFTFVKRPQPIAQQPTTPQDKNSTYTIKEFGFSFSYPKEYNGKEIQITPKPNFKNVYIIYENKGSGESTFQVLAKVERINTSTEIGTSYGSTRYHYDPTTNTWRNQDNKSSQLTWDELLDQLANTRSNYPVLTTNGGVKAYPHNFGTYGSVYQAYRLFSPDHTIMANFYIYLQNIFDTKQNETLYQDFTNARNILIDISKTANFES